MEIDTGSSTLLALMVANKTRTHLLVRQFKNEVWSVPILTIRENDDPSAYVYRLTNQLSGGFEPVSIKWFHDEESTDDSCDHIYKSMIFDFRYKGLVKKAVPPVYEYKFLDSKWVMPRILLEQYELNYPTEALVNQVVNKCLL